MINNLILASQELLADHPVNQKRIAEGKDPANSIWPWSPGYRPQMKPLSGKYPAIKKGAVISAVDLINGIGHYAGLRRIEMCIRDRRYWRHVGRIHSEFCSHSLAFCFGYRVCRLSSYKALLSRRNSGEKITFSVCSFLRMFSV